MKERRLSRDEIIGQAKQGVDQSTEAQRRTKEQLEATRVRFNNLPSPIRLPLRGLTRTDSKLTRLINTTREIDRQVANRRERLTRLEESKDLNLETFKTYYKWHSSGQTISIIRGRVNGTRIRVNRLQTGVPWFSDDKYEYMGFRYDDELKMPQEEAKGIFDKYHRVLADRNRQEGIKRSTLGGDYPLDYWRQITQPRPTNKGRSRKGLTL